MKLSKVTSGHWLLRAGRLRLGLDFTRIPLPRVEYENQGPDFHYVAFVFGDKWGAPIVLLEITL